MSNLELHADEWLDVVERDYLGTFVREGGASVKVVVARPEQVEGFVNSLLARGEGLGYVTAHVDESTARVYYMDRLFNAVARQVPWSELALDFMKSALRSHAYKLPEGPLTTQAIAAANGMEASQVYLTCQQLLAKSVLREYAMGKDFRLAMYQLCMAAVAGDDLLKDRAERINEWLRGEITSVGTLRLALIFEKINRYTARAILASTAEWVRLVGKAGLLAVVDVSRFALSKPQAVADGTLVRPPSRAAVMDTYELMRQCIDGTDEMAGAMIIFVTGYDFVDDERRGMRSYAALEQRLAEDVRDRSRANPHAPMVRIAVA